MSSPIEKIKRNLSTLSGLPHMTDEQLTRAAAAALLGVRGWLRDEALKQPVSPLPHEPYGSGHTYAERQSMAYVAGILE